jgi:ketosteroid isomerase-like protein
MLFCVSCKLELQQYDTEALARELLKADEDFADLSASTTARQAFAAYMAPDGMMLPRGSDGAIEGYEASLALFDEGDDPGYELLWQPQFAEVADSGDMGWTWGKYQVVVDGIQASDGKYVNIWKKQEDGAWKVRLDMGNQKPAQSRSE